MALVYNIRVRSFLVFLLLAFLLMILDVRGALAPVHSVSDTVSAPMTYFLYQTRLTVLDWFSFFRFWKSGEARIKFLEQRNLELMAQGQKAAGLENENAALRAELGAPKRSAATLLPAVVVGVGKKMEIGAGVKDGVKVGMTVTYLDNLVGLVSQVSDRQSFVELPTSSDSKIPVKIGKVSGLVLGQYNTAMVLSRVAQNEAVNSGDLVTTETGSFLVGKVGKITSSKTDLFIQAEVLPLVHYEDLTWVFITF